jgi:putative endonuclease
MMGLLFRAATALRRRLIFNDHGRVGEDIAHGYLRRSGCRVVARNYHPPSGGGEIDIVAWQNAKLLIVEVKTRGTTEYGQPEDAVDTEKQHSIERAARDYTRRAGVEWNRVRFDIVSVILSHPPQVDWVRDAFH